MDIVRQGVDLDLFQLFQSLNLVKQRFYANILIILIFEEASLESIELVLSKETHIVHLIITKQAKIEISFFQFPQVLFQGLAVLFVPKAILEVDLIEIADHIFGLVLGVVDLLDAVEDDSEDDLVGHDARILQEVLIALLDALYGRFQHVLWLGVHADADCQLYATFGCSLEKR